MGFFSDILGGTDDSAQKRQLKQNQKARELIERNTKQARADILKLFPAGDEARNIGLQRAAGVVAGTAPRQSQAIRQSNVFAQQQLLRGLPQIQNAILGRDVNLGGLKAQVIKPDFTFLRQKFPQFPSGADLVQQQDPTPDIAQLLAGLSLPNV